MQQKWAADRGRTGGLFDNFRNDLRTGKELFTNFRDELHNFSNKRRRVQGGSPPDSLGFMFDHPGAAGAAKRQWK